MKRLRHWLIRRLGGVPRDGLTTGQCYTFTSTGSFTTVYPHSWRNTTS